MIGRTRRESQMGKSRGTIYALMSPLIVLVIAAAIILLLIWVLSLAANTNGASTPDSDATRLEPSQALAPSDELRHFHLQVHGIYHRNKDRSSRQKIIRSCGVGDILQFVPEPDNPVDPDAIMVCRENGDQLGYVDAGNAARLSVDLDHGWTYRVTVDEVFPADRAGYYGCRIRIGVLTMSQRTEARRKKKAANDATSA